MSTISNLHDDWITVLNAQSAKKQELEKERAPLQADIDAFDKGAPTGLWGKLKHQMVKNVGLSPLRDKIGKINTKIGNAHYAITSKARETYDYLAGYAMAMPAAAHLAAERDVKARLLSIYATGYDATVATIKACEDAASQEWIDVRSDSVQVQGTSFLQTKQAKAMLQNVKSTLQSVNQQANGLKLEGIGGLNEPEFFISLELNLQQALFPANNLPGHEISKMNAIALTSSANDLKPTANKLKSLMQKLQNDIDGTTGKAIGYARAADPAVDKLANSISPYLPTEIASRMSKRPAPGGPAP